MHVKVGDHRSLLRYLQGLDRSIQSIELRCVDRSAHFFGRAAESMEGLSHQDFCRPHIQLTIRVEISKLDASVHHQAGQGCEGAGSAPTAVDASTAGSKHKVFETFHDGAQNNAVVG